jgi:DNA polymerase-3 subunit delta
MKATQANFAATLPRAIGAASVFFLCGGDDAGAQDGAAMIVAQLPDAGERVELSGADLRRDPVRLGDEARSTSLFGGARHILVRAAGDEAHDAVANLIEDAVPACPVVIVATGATDKSRTAKLLADRRDALVAVFHPPDLTSVTAAVRRMAAGAGLRIDDAAAQRIARAANLDTRIARGEVDKLALYLDASVERPRSVEPAALDAMLARTDEDGFAPLVAAVLGGATAAIGDELRRVRDMRLNPVGICLAFERRAAQLVSLSAKLGARGDIKALMQAERIFWKDQAEVAAQLRRWRGRPLERLVPRLIALHRQLLGDSQNAELLLEHALTEIAGVASRRG